MRKTLAYAFVMLFAFATVAYAASVPIYNPVAGIISVTKSGSGTGVVKSWDGAINCGPICSASFASANISLTATPDAGSKFVKWTGCDYVVGNFCGVYVPSSGTKYVDAQFDKNLAPQGNYKIKKFLGFRIR